MYDDIEYGEYSLQLNEPLVYNVLRRTNQKRIGNKMQTKK